jgi:hypothetical protein
MNRRRDAGRSGGILDQLHAVLEAEGGTLAEAIRRPVSDPRPAEVFGPLVAAGRRTATDPTSYALLVESILEGYLVHHAAGRVVQHPDPDLRLLAGDYLYAYGLVRLASIGDLDAVDELADLISLCAQAHATANEDGTSAPWALTGGLWASAVMAVAEGSWPALREAKRVLRAGDGEVIKKVLHVARDRARECGLEPQLEQALIAFQQTVEGSVPAS